MGIIRQVFKDENILLILVFKYQKIFKDSWESVEDESLDGRRR